MQQTANKYASAEAKALLRFLEECAGHRLITGQHTQTNSCEEIDYIRQQTGKEPLLRGFELLSYSPNINFKSASEECLREVYENQGTMDTALSWAKEKRGIVALSFHWFSPIGGRDKSFYTENTDFDAAKVLEEGTPERAAFFYDLDVIAVQLRRFQKAGIPLLWRPFHEAEGEWFWWGARGKQTAAALFRLMFDYYTKELGLNHLLWVWNCSAPDAYPGDDCVDVVSLDQYLDAYTKTDYRQQYELLRSVTTEKKVAALAEVGILPDITMLEKSHIPWAYYMTWSKDFCIGEQYNRTEQLRKMYDSSYAVHA